VQDGTTSPVAAADGWRMVALMEQIWGQPVKRG